MSRYLTYILVLIATIFITYSKQIPRTRRSIGAIVLQLALLFITQLYFHFHIILLHKESLYCPLFIKLMNKHIFQILGRLNRFYLLKLFIPLISIVGVIIITILLLASSFILLLNLRHRDVTKVYSTTSSHQVIMHLSQ